MITRNFIAKKMKKIKFSGIFGINKNYNTYFIRGESQQQLLQLPSQQELAKYINPLSDSFFVFHRPLFNSQLEQWQKKLPSIYPYYKVKSNFVTELLQDVNKKEMGFSCIFSKEIELLKNLSIDPSNILFTNASKSENELIKARDLGIKRIIVDSLEEMQLIKKIAPEMKILWRVLITTKDEEQIQFELPNIGYKFKDIEDTNQFLIKAKELGINLSGLSFSYIERQNNRDLLIEKAIGIGKEIINFGKEIGHCFDSFNIGDFFSQEGVSEKSENLLKELVKDLKGIKIFAEPGRIFSGNSGFLFFRIIGRKMKKGNQCYVVNESIYHSFNRRRFYDIEQKYDLTFEGKYDQFYSCLNDKGERIIKEEEMNKYLKNSTIFGLSCAGDDTICKEILLPDFEIGDWIVMGGMGSYTYQIGSSFNGIRTQTKLFVHE